MSHPMANDPGTAPRAVAIDSAAPTSARAKGGALSQLGALRDRMAQSDPTFAVAATVERDAEAFCDKVRADLKGRRIAAGLSQQELAERVELSQSAVSKLESGRGDLSLKTLFRIAEALQCKAALLFEPVAGAGSYPQAQAISAADPRLYVEQSAEDFIDFPPSAGLHEQVARALVNKGETLAALGRSEEAIASYDEVLRRFESPHDRSFHEAPATSLAEAAGRGAFNPPQAAAAVRSAGAATKPASHDMRLDVDWEGDD